MPWKRNSESIVYEQHQKYSSKRGFEFEVEIVKSRSGQGRKIMDYKTRDSFMIVVVSNDLCRYIPMAAQKTEKNHLFLEIRKINFWAIVLLHY